MNDPLRGEFGNYPWATLVARFLLVEDGSFKFTDLISDMVVSGLVPADTANLVSDISAGLAYVTGKRVAKHAKSNTYVANKDTWVDIDSEGVYTFPSVSNTILIDACEVAWDELVDTDVTVSLDTTIKKVGTSSVKLAVGANLGAGDILATMDMTALDISSGNAARLWVRSSVATDAGDYTLLLSETAEGASAVETIDIPALTKDVWLEVEVNLVAATADLNAIISVGIACVVDKGAHSLYIDDIRATVTAAVPSVTADSIRVSKVATDSLQITGVTDMRQSYVLFDSPGTLKIIPATPLNAVAAEGKVTSSGAFVPGSHATTTLTSDATVPVEDKITTIGTTVYRWRDTLAQAYDVQIEATAAACLDNLKDAINATGTPGTEYFAGTLAHPDVVAFTNTDTVQTITARLPGTAANAFPTTEDSDHLAWADTTMGGGTGASTAGVATAAATITIGTRTYTFVVELTETAGATAIIDQILYGGSAAVALDNLKLAIDAGATVGTNYSTGTVVNADVSSGTNTNTTQIVTAKVSGVIGHLIALSDTMANTAWDAVVMGTETAGVDGTVAEAGEERFDATYRYLCVADNTVADANWKTTTLA